MTYLALHVYSQVLRIVGLFWFGAAALVFILAVGFGVDESLLMNVAWGGAMAVGCMLVGLPLLAIAETIAAFRQIAIDVARIDDRAARDSTMHRELLTEQCGYLSQLAMHAAEQETYDA